MYCILEESYHGVVIELYLKVDGGGRYLEEAVAKYQEICLWVKKRLESGELKPGDKVESEYKLCQRFQVSRQTVRHAISVLEEEGIVERFRGSGTYISSKDQVTPKKEKTMQIAVMTTFVQEYIFSTIIRELEEQFSNAEYSLQISVTNNSVEKERFILKNILNKNTVDGLIAETTKSGLPNPNLDIYREIMARGIPVLFINSYYPQLEAPHVSLNDKMAGKLVTNYLLQCGHQNIAAVFKADDGQGHQRYAGYVEALMEANVKVDDKRIVWVDSEMLTDFKQSEDWIMHRLQGCTACVCYNDVVANKLLSVCKKKKIRIPGDLSLISIDNSDIARFCEVPLTSAENPVRDLARIAARQMLDMIDGKKVPETTELETEIITRNSVAILNQGRL